MADPANYMLTAKTSTMFTATLFSSLLCINKDFKSNIAW